MNDIELSSDYQGAIEVLEGGTPRINLATSEDVRREMSKIYREARARKIPAQEATRLIYVLTQILKAHELVFIESRLERLEDAHSKKGG